MVITAVTGCLSSASRALLTLSSLSILLLLSSFTGAQGTTFSCAPSWGQATRDGTISPKLDLAPLDPATTLTFINTVDAGQLCTLFIKSYSDAIGDQTQLEFYTPVGRSYDGNVWERVAGRYAHLVEFSCSVASCDVTLPDMATNEYYMGAYKYELTASQSWARFFERASFGPTPDWLSTFPAASFEAWILAQNLLPPTSHREYFRTRLNPRSLEMYKYGKTGPHPCMENSRWRAFALTRKDVVMSTGDVTGDLMVDWPMTMHNVTLETRTQTSSGGSDKVVLKFGDHVRTVSDEFYWSPGGTVAIPDGMYRLCAVDEYPGAKITTGETDRTLYSRFSLINPDNKVCTHVSGGNPDVIIDAEVMGSPHILDFSSFTDDFTDIGYSPMADTPDNSVKIFTKTDYYTTNDAACKALPDPDEADFRSKGWEYSPYYEGQRHPDWGDLSSRSVLDQPVFALIDGKYYIHDRRFTPLENTINDPLPDGGGQQTIDSVFKEVNLDDVGAQEDLTIIDDDENPRTGSTISGNEQAIFCSNSEPNVFNEANCKLSIEPNACVREGGDDEDTVVVTKLNSGSGSSLAQIGVHILDLVAGVPPENLAAGVPLEITGLTYDVNTWPLPCTMNIVSRFKRVDGVTSNTNCYALGPALNQVSLNAFEHLLQYSVSNNEYVKDIVMYEAKKDLACQADDADNYSFAVWFDGICWQNVHPQESNVYLVKDSTTSDHSVNGNLDWTSEPANFNMAAWTAAASNTANFEYWGRKGDVRILAELMDSLGIYVQEGGLPVTAAPTGNPSAAPSESPSMSLMPSMSLVPSIKSDSPSISSGPSLEPSSSLQPSTSAAPSSQPSSIPSAEPSSSFAPSDVPSLSGMPSISSSSGPSSEGESEGPSAVPSISIAPSMKPSTSSGPTLDSSVRPSGEPSFSTVPSLVPSSSAFPTLPPSQLSHVARTKNDRIFYLIVNDSAITYVILETKLTQKSGGVLVCGSSGEIASNPLQDNYFDYWNWRLDSSPHEGEQKKTVWTNIALSADDQLCQRTAFALSQIFAISPDFLAYPKLSEAHMNFYDGFVRNCHSTYKNVFKTVAFSVKMGQQLSHIGSSSIRDAYDRENTVRFPDENFARESMQLETVGLDMLNMDGTKIRDTLGNPIPTYDTNDILTLARVWTGFNYATRRGNYEEKDPNVINWNDPMTLNDVERHDWFPKKDLLDNWIGDHYPLCSDMYVDSSHHGLPFLQRGATYKLLGRSSAPRYQYDNSEWDGNEQVKKFVLEEDSNLYAKLCNSVDGVCTFPSVVTVTENIVCTKLECEVDTVRVIQVKPDIFYEYVRRPCVHLAFIDNAKTVFAGSSRYGASMCANPSLPIATQTCCPSGVSSSSEIDCAYHGELVRYNENEVRCGGAQHVCPAGTNVIADQGKCSGQVGYSMGSPRFNHFHWTSSPCTFKIKVRLDGMVALVHVPEDASANVVRYVEEGVGNMNFFHIPWPKDDYVGDELFPHIDNQCGEETCTEQDDWTCLCDVTVDNSAAFSAASPPADSTEIRSILKIGSVPPEYFGSPGNAGGAFSAGTDLGGGVTVYHLLNDEYGENSIFKLTDEFDEFADGSLYLKNQISKIQIGDVNGSYFAPPARKPLVMSNPVLFHDLVQPEIRDSHYEIDAVIHHLTSHPSTAPFVSNMLIQHFGISNPSPGYIERVATAYKEGSYTGPNGSAFGDGKYSNLDACIAAILLDQEATANTLDADPAYGGIKEPIIKVLQFMRSMEYAQTTHDRNIYPKLFNMGAKVGQMAYESPDQFSFFLSDYNPPGQFAQSGLFAPPAQVLTMSTTVATVEGFFSLARHGLSGEGFGQYVFPNPVVNAGDISRSVGYLSFTPSGSSDEDKVQEIADLLTSGRLSADAVARIAAAVGGMSAENKIRFAQQLIATSPEFHTANLAKRTGNDRAPTPVQERTSEPYKAIVVLLMFGGLDSFNVLTPHTSCRLYRSYRKNREVLALRDSEMMPISNSDPDQPCETFGVNKRIPILKEIYDNGHGQFHANIGHLSKPVTKNNWYSETQTHLFSHTTMGREAQLVDAFQEDGWSTGVCGRMLDVLQRRGESVTAIGVDAKGPIVEGNPSLGRTVDVISSGGLNTLNRRSLTDQSNDLAVIEDLMKYLNEETSLESGVFANYWAQNLIDVLNKTDALSDMLGTVTLQNDHKFTSSVGSKLKMVAKLMLLNEARSVNRDVFVIHSGGHDGHALAKENLQGLLPDINSGIAAFYKEMTDQAMLDDVTFVMISEFGRTITPNSGLGSDHAWGGNAFVWGGQIAGSKILGQYPTSFDNSDVTQIGRGRLVPFRSWESMWYGVSNWFGITDGQDMQYVLPNNGNMGCQLYTDRDMYTVGNTTINGCNDRSVGMKLSMLLTVPRYLTGIEQKRICKAAIFLTVQNANVTARCIVVDQQVIVNFDFVRRVLSAGDLDTRFLEAGTPVNFTLDATVSFEYDNPADGSLAGTDYVENSIQFTDDMNEQISNGGDCTAGSGRRRLDGNCEFALDNCDQVTSFEADLTDAPSQFPSLSSKPSSQPSTSPSGLPSQHPSTSIIPSLLPSISYEPSSKPSTSPERTPSFEPSISLSPTPPAPSSKPSIASSSRPSRDCPIVLDECFYGGMWSPFTCECLCLSPYCPDADSGRCAKTSCDANYHETLFDDLPAPWFKYGSSCTATKELPSSVSAIYPSKEDCCSSEYPDSSGGCVTRPAGVFQLSYNGKFQLDGVSCPNSGSERASSAGVMARSILSTLCDQVSGLNCDDGDKVVVKKFCGEDYDIEAEYSSGTRRLQTADGDDTVDYVFFSQSLDRDELEGIQSLLSAFLQGTTLTSFLTAVLADILASNPPPTLQSLTALYYTAVNAFITGLGLYYPAWGKGLETCFSDGNQDPFMNRGHGNWLYENLDSCCQRYYGWDEVGCRLRNAEATLVSGTISSTVDPTDNLYFPDWERTDTCINDGTAPPYMKKQASLWMYEGLTGCCQAYYGWEGGFVSCMSSQGGDPPTTSPITESWYVDWEDFVCVQSCEGSSPCGGIHEAWDTLHGSKFQCCQTHLSWKEDCTQS